MHFASWIKDKIIQRTATALVFLLSSVSISVSNVSTEIEGPQTKTDIEVQVEVGPALRCGHSDNRRSEQFTFPRKITENNLGKLYIMVS